MPREKTALLQGTLDMLILKALDGDARHGYSVARTIEQATDDVLSIDEGSLYPALHRMEVKGWIKSSWGLSENNRRAKYYELTGRGRKQLTVETKEWARYSRAVAQMLHPK